MTDVSQLDAENAEPIEDAPYEPPDHLPTPVVSHADDSPRVMVALAVGLVAAGITGGAMFAAGQLFYIYILYNWAAGAAVGWAINRGQGTSTNKAALLAVTLACSVAVYATYNLAMYLYVASEIEGGTAAVGFVEFLLYRAAEEPFIRGMKPGVVGNFIIWTVELGITAVYAWRKVSVQLTASRFGSVPEEVSAFVAYLLGEGNTEPNLRAELAKRGWTRIEDQDRAIGAGRALIDLMAIAASEESSS